MAANPTATPQTPQPTRGPQPRKNQLAAMGQAMPVANQMVADQMNAARQTGLQQSIAQAVAAPAPNQAQALGVQQVQQQGQIQQQQQQANAGQQAKLGEAFIQDREAEAKNVLRTRKFDTQKKLYAEEAKLNQLDSRLKKDLVDDTMVFRKDELGRTLFNERQLLDYKVASAKSDEELAAYEQQVTQESEKRMTMLKIAQQKINQELQQSFEQGEQELDQAHQRRLIEAKKAIEEKMRREQNKARNRASMFNAAGTVLGMAAAVGITVATGGAAAAALPYLGAAGTLGGAGGNVLAGTTKI